VGEVTTDMIAEYIRKHDEESPPENFAILVSEGVSVPCFRGLEPWGFQQAST